jgi:hypothetical protein
VTRFIDCLLVITTNNYNTIAIFTLWKLPHAKSCPVCSGFTRRFLVTASNSGDFLIAPTKSSLHRLQYRIHYQLTMFLAYSISARTTNKTQIFHCWSPTVALLRIWYLARGMCLHSRCPETALVYPSNLRSLHSNGYKRYDMKLLIYKPRNGMADFGEPCSLCGQCESGW